MRKHAESIAVVALAVLVVVATHFYTVFFTPPSFSGPGESRVVDIPHGTSFRVIADALEREGVIRDADDFLFAARVMGAQKKVKAGEYELTTAMTPLAVLKTLVAGEVRKYFVTIPEGYNIADVAAVLERERLADAGEFIETATDPDLVAELGLKGSSLEGYLFPDSYLFTRGMSAEEMARAMVERFRSVYYPDIAEAARARGMSLSKVVTLASIIEKETGSAGERRLISAVFHNRLKKRIRLQSDPTVIYGIENFDGNLTKRHLRTPGPYNTYMNYGLPPGPIANPGKASLEAAIDPAPESYLYFVSRNDGTHHFSRTLREHNMAVRKFQLNYRARTRPGGA
jgi:UPF0755 protein